jgi:hypothetical protein
MLYWIMSANMFSRKGNILSFFYFVLHWFTILLYLINLLHFKQKKLILWRSLKSKTIFRAYAGL